jgi:thiamine-phosphate pyrophosphorylase
MTVKGAKFREILPFSLPKLYPITDVRLSGLSHAEQVARLSEGGATLVQLREKRLVPRQFYREAEEAISVARQRGVRLIINDRVDIALALGADGVHLGQDDLDAEAARRLLGAEAIIGVSTHSLEQVLEAALLPVDYIAIGPIFDTSSKENPDPSIGLEGLRRVRASLAGDRKPLVAIGGIDRVNARAALDAGADAVATISALLRRGDPPPAITRRTREFLASL